MYSLGESSPVHRTILSLHNQNTITLSIDALPHIPGFCSLIYMSLRVLPRLIHNSHNEDGRCRLRQGSWHGCLTSHPPRTLYSWTTEPSLKLICLFWISESLVQQTIQLFVCVCYLLECGSLVFKYEFSSFLLRSYLNIVAL